MKKLFIVSLIALGASAFAGAEEDLRPMPVNAPPQAIKAIKAVLATTTRPAMMLEENVPLTGDKMVDDKIKALVKERNDKLKAIHEEFQRKLKELIGERKDMRASTTDARRLEIQNKMMNASGTRERPPVMASGTPMRKPPVEAPRNIFKRFFQSFLGNPRDLQAGEVR